MFFFFFFFFLESALFSVDSYVLLSIGINNLVAGDSQDQPYQIRCSRSRGPLSNSAEICDGAIGPFVASCVR